MTSYSHKVGACTFLIRMCCPAATCVTTPFGGGARSIGHCNPLGATYGGPLASYPDDAPPAQSHVFQHGVDLHERAGCCVRAGGVVFRCELQHSQENGR